MAERIVLFGATGYTGRLTAKALHRRGARPVLAARGADALATLAAELDGADTAVADVARPETVRALVERGDVLVSTVGPFLRFGRPALEAAVDAGAHYFDSTGEPPFIRSVFDEFGPRAAAAGCGLLMAFGNDWVPGNLAGAWALDEAGDDAVRLDVGYFVSGFRTSGGTRASAAGVLLEPGHTFTAGAVRPERGAARVRTFNVREREVAAISVGGTEQLALPRLAPALRDVDVWLGAGRAARAAQGLSAVGALAARVPGFGAASRAATERFVKGSTGGPDDAARAGSTTHFIAVASSPDGDALATVHLDGPDPYDITAAMLSWGAAAALDGGLHGVGALGPADAFGLDRLRAGCAEAGITRV